MRLDVMVDEQDMGCTQHPVFSALWLPHVTFAPKNLECPSYGIIHRQDELLLSSRYGTLVAMICEHTRASNDGSLLARLLHIRKNL